jgi:hypothetical protein
MGGPASGWPARSKSGPFAVDFERRSFTDAADDQGERVAPEDVYGNRRIIAAFNKFAAQRENRRCTGDAAASGGGSVRAGERGLAMGGVLV